MNSTNKLVEYDSITIEPMEDEMLDSENEDFFAYKCGDIFLERSKVLCFVCTLCEKRFIELNAFSTHLHEHSDIQYFESEPNRNEISEHEEDLIEFKVQDDSADTDPGAPNEPPLRQKVGSVDTNCGAHKVPRVTWIEKEKVKVLRSQDDSADAEFSSTTLEAKRKEILEILVDEEEEFIEISLLHKSVEVDELTQQQERPCSTVSILSTASSERPSDQENLNYKYDCKFCALQFNLAKDLRQHKCTALKAEIVASSASTTKPTSYPCSVCGKIFKRKWNLRTHSYSHTKIKPFMCDRCPATYANKQNLTVHQRRHNGDKPFFCDYCSRSFVSSTERISHMRTHTGEKPYVCQECGRGHSTSSQLLEHRRRVHMDVRNYQCLDCGKAFRTSSHFRSHHEAVHEELPRNKKCILCKAAFKTAAALQAHSKIHKEKCYKCEICGKTFAQHPGLYMHMTTHKNKISESSS